ncbi:MAG: glycosyltransferase family 39 protein [Bacillota bacterium]|nr:glycosyltransferase family 39 protein [Bacillota bacterium]
MKKINLNKEKIFLMLILILSAVLNIVNLGIEGYANQYYAAGVKSMTMSLKNFFFVSFDPAGFVTIDKPPLGFWIQAISAKIFGFSGWSILLPEALAGVISVYIIYLIVKRTFGSSAALISALFLALTPVFVAVSRNNTCDNLLVLALLLSCLALTKSFENGKKKYLFISLALVGVGFNIKMLQAYMIIPAVYISYLMYSGISLKKRIINLIAGSLILASVSLCWAAAVDLVPASYRPYVGSSSNNTEMELIFGHNGLERLTSSTGNMGQMPEIPSDNQTGSQNMQSPPQGQNMQTPPGGNGQDQSRPQGLPNDGQGRMGNGPEGKQNGGGMGGTFGGNETASIFRLFSNNSLSDQIIWLFPLSIFGFIASAIREKLKPPFSDKRKLGLIMWIMWLLPEFIYFSFTKGLFHPYYLTMLAPPIAALAGIGIISMWEMYKEGGNKSYILPAALIINGGVELLILSYYYSTSDITKILMIITTILCLISSVLLILLKLKDNIKLKKKILALGLIGILAAPAVWSGTTMFYTMSGTFPSAGIELASSNNGSKGMIGGMGTNNTGNDTTEKLVAYLKKNVKNEKYLVAVQSSNSYASEIIIKYGESVMTLGGFSGSDNILTLAQFKKLVKDGAVRYAIVSGDNGAGGNSEITNWITKNGKAVSDSEWSGNSSSNSSDENQFGGNFGGNSVTLYDLKGIS